MSDYHVNSVMVPLAEYATVAEDVTLYETVLSLEETQEKYEETHTRYTWNCRC